MDKGIVYILTNPCMPDWIKIGMSEKNNVDDRLNELNQPSNMPLSFRAYAIYHVDNPKKIEQHIHGLLDGINSSLRARETLDTGKIREREFFKIKKEVALSIFYNVAGLRGDDKSCINIIDPSAEEQMEEKISQKRRPNIKLIDVVPDQAELQFLYDESIVCVADIKNNKLIYENNTYSISQLAQKLLVEKLNWPDRSVQGTLFFKYKGQTLVDLRDQKEVDGNDDT